MRVLTVFVFFAVPNPLPKCPKDVFDLSDTFVAQKCNWEMSFTFQRVEKAQARHGGYSFMSSSSSSSEDILPPMGRPTWRDKQAAAEMLARAETNVDPLIEKNTAVEAETRAEETTQVRVSNIDVNASAKRSSGKNPSELVPNPSMLKSIVCVVHPQASFLVPCKDEKEIKDKGENVSSQKHAASTKGKASAEEKAVKKLRRSVAAKVASEPAPSTNIASEGFCNDSSSSARLFSKITRPGVSFPPPDTLIHDRVYTKMALLGVKVCSPPSSCYLIFLCVLLKLTCFLLQFIAYLNQLALDYEQEARVDKLCIDDARKKTAEIQAELDKATSKHSSELE